MAEEPLRSSASPLRHRLHEIIFEADTPAGKLFDVLLLWIILCSIAIVCLESVSAFSEKHQQFLRLAEWAFTILFTVEYVLRLICVRRPLRYARSFFGIIDLAAVVPTYLSIFFPGAQSLVVIRALRLLRVFRILKLARYLGAATVLVTALKASRQKITIFLTTVLTVDLIVGAIMYMLEGAQSGFTSIPRAFYWAIVTMTTVGYGDIAPVTVPGQSLAAVLMILGYGIIAVPTGIVSVEIAKAAQHDEISTQCCPNCSLEGHDFDAMHCKFCGHRL